MDKLTAIKIKYEDGTYSDQIPVSVLGENVEWDATHTLVDILGSIDVDVTGTIQDQISQLFNEKVSTSALQSYVATQLNEDVAAWLNVNVNPVGSAVIVDKSLTISGAAADAKIVKKDLDFLNNNHNINYKDIYFRNEVAAPADVIEYHENQRIMGYSTASGNRFPMYASGNFINLTVIELDFQKLKANNIVRVISSRYKYDTNDGEVFSQNFVAYKTDGSSAENVWNDYWMGTRDDNYYSWDVNQFTNHMDKLVISLNNLHTLKFFNKVIQNIIPSKAIIKDASWYGDDIYADYIYKHSIPNLAVQSIKVYNAVPGYFYQIEGLWKNHVTDHDRHFRIRELELDENNNEITKQAFDFSKNNEDGQNPTFTETCRAYAKRSDVYVEAVINWNAATNNYDIRGIINPKYYIYNNSNNYNYNNSLLFNSFFKDGNLVSSDTGEKSYSSSYNTSTNLPNIVESNTYRSWSIPIPNKGQILISLNAWTASSYDVCQLYILRDNGTVIINTAIAGQNASSSNNYWNKDINTNIMTFNCEYAFSAGGATLFVCAPISAVLNNNFYIKMVHSYTPSWLNMSSQDIDPVEMVVPYDIYTLENTDFTIYHQNMFRYFDVRHFMKIISNTNIFDDYKKGLSRWRKDNDSISAIAQNFNIKYYLNDTINAKYVTHDITRHKISSNAGSGLTKNILFIGDSLSDAGVYPAEVKTLFDADVMNVTLLGTQDTTSGANEGYSGWRAYTFTKCPSNVEDWVTWGRTPAYRIENPFWNSTTETFDFTLYMNNQGYNHVDYVFICLGTNDIARGNHQSDEEIISYWNTMINSIKAFDNNIKIGLWLPPGRAVTDYADINSLSSALKMNKLILDTWNNKKNDNIYLVPINLNIDPYHDYNFTEVPFNTRDSSAGTLTKYTDAVHCNSNGYKHIADVFYAFIKYLATLE